MTALRGVAELCLLCALAQVPAAAPKEIWLDVPFVAQVGNSCGPACISMVMKYWAASSHRQPDAAADEAAIRRSLNSRNSKGVPTRDVTRYFENHGFRAYAFVGEWADLEHHVAQGRPLIVAIKQGSGTFHYLVVAGIDNAHDLLLANDPARRKLQKMKRADFESAWSRCGFWTLLVLPKDES
ncbi:MAG: C39 family peptidase [Acidobacteriia bacterium]|nr:C39 family peptidase [Terriglobia bacterium]